MFKFKFEDYRMVSSESVEFLSRKNEINDFFTKYFHKFINSSKSYKNFNFQQTFQNPINKN